ncbi:MAG: hypothetical protein BGO96_04690 [Micrococcales bacterium 73-15]|uniref:hypothetical protein n=1 Tax=Salana multivorans TaxID=120377 RepID=UPI00095A405A|nr:hypothetical protein [Salana multivorans]OJX98678.1 MAG: hypothetical protein BGO96_04690 [Micrococcales bacterium 73-15]
MRVPVDVWEDLAAEVAGTSVGDTLEVVAWRGTGVPVRLGVQSWAISSADRQVPDQLTLTVDDDGGRLTPWGMGDLLAPGGSRLSVAWVSGTTGLRVPWGIFRIRRADPGAVWRTGPDGARRVHSGGQVTLTADSDPQSTAVLCRLDADVPTKPTRLGEVVRLMAAVGAAVDVRGIADMGRPAGLVYDEGRLDAVEDHLAALDAVHRMGPDGSLQIIPAVSEPVWTVQGGDEGALVRVGTSLSDEAVYNGVTSRAEVDQAGTRVQLVGRARIENGPLAWSGPFGPRLMFHASPATSQAGVDSDAARLLATRQARGETTIDVECHFHPGIQVHDWVTVVAATSVDEASLPGRVVELAARSVSGAGSTPAKAMSLTVAVPTQTLEAVAQRVARG